MTYCWSLGDSEVGHGPLFRKVSEELGFTAYFFAERRRLILEAMAAKNRRGSAKSARTGKTITATKRAPQPDILVPEALEHLRLFKAVEIARVTGLSRSLIYSLMESGELKYVSINRTRRVRAEDVEDLIKRNLVAAA
jgi:excisionase family DNA binding protein